MIALLLGTFIGFLMCIPVGPINVMVINTQIKSSSQNALAIALGGSLMDVVYFMIILSGLSMFDFSENITIILKSVGIALIFFLGIKDLMAKPIVPNENEEIKTKKAGLLGYLLLGVVIYTSNPTLILTMTGLGAFIKSLTLFPMTQTNIIIHSLGLGAGSFLWFVFLSKITNKFKEAIRNKYLLTFNRVSGSLMIILSLFMLTKLIFPTIQRTL
ncbi:MAG: hypothetical protein COW00_19900 [Bdellovibrio sp. CG12_big_fil_rev_8_21_14_0_65_39_13]|nr:MAG: hypothetical protein COW78_02075 [Bdellovibrio sp. CG22_combo_CG10-13_8_21_14_all_39_27]PIQ57638.1 MAG: hypothetical protein COW00_19900 [Bdellovibrio sp. CG12_big_fil_rev_8_21_14_0_65_39_13]PIR35802.1 MAG: hypothetical protein COV37_06280 [Bdellovibrio sp. CG11_big_fil_rev_8_21_14_0_20_39_38]